MDAETADHRAGLREEGEGLVELQQAQQAFEVEEAPAPAEQPAVRSTMRATRRTLFSTRQTISDPGMVLRPPTPLAMQVREVCTLRLIIAFGVTVFIIAVCSMATGPDSTLFLGEVQHKDVFNSEHCYSLCMKGHQSPNAVPEYCHPVDDGHANGYEYLPDKHTCMYKVAPPAWKPYTTIALLVFSVALIIDGLEAEVVLFGAVIFLAALKILTVKEAFAGLGNKSVVALGLLFPIAAAVDETGALEIVLGKVLGTPKSLIEAMFKLMFVVALLSACLSNTAVVAAMIPAIVSWSRRINMSPSLMLMPLSFGAQLGGSCTLIGSSHCLVASQATTSLVGSPMKMFDLTPLGIVLTIFITMACVGFSFLLPQQQSEDDADEEEEEEEEASSAATSSGYRVGLVVIPESAIVGRSIEEIGLTRIPGVKSVYRCSERPNASPLTPGEEIEVTLTAEGLISVRQVRGLALINAGEVAMLGTHRRRRRVFEVTMHALAPLLSREASAAHLRRVYGSCILAVRRPGSQEPVYWRRSGQTKLLPGDVVILEADVSFLGSASWSENFALVREIPNSAPPRSGTPTDTPRSIFVCGGMLTLIMLVALKDLDIKMKDMQLNPFYKLVSLDVGAGVLVMLLLATRAVTPAAAFSSIKPSVLLTVASALGIGEALKKTGVANFLAASVGSVARSGGSFGVFGAVYLISVGLSMFINNSATIAIVAPMLTSLSQATVTAEGGEPIPGQYLRYILVYAAGSCFTTPLGYQTNMMVMADGGYAFGDFMKFGGPVQLVHGILCIVLCWGCMSMGILGG